jgi:palmitoyltransferase
MGLDDNYSTDPISMEDNATREQEIAQFRQRQTEDLKRWERRYEPVRRRQPFHKRFDEAAVAANDASSPSLYVQGDSEGEEGWRDSEGQALKDFGLDEEAEFYDEDDIPLGELLRKRRRQKAAVE